MPVMSVIPRYALWQHPISGVSERVRVIAYVHPGYFDVLDYHDARRRVAREWLTFLPDREPRVAGVPRERSA